MPETKDLSSPHGKTLLTWTFLEYEQHDRSIGWYAIALIASVAIFVWSIMTQNYLFAIFIVIASILLIRQHTTEPARLTFSITEDGIDIHNRHFYPFRDLEDFWMAYEPPEVKQIYFTFKFSVRPRLSIPLEDSNPIHIRQTLSQYIRENFEREGEPTGEALARILKL